MRRIRFIDQGAGWHRKTTGKNIVMHFLMFLLLLLAGCTSTPAKGPEETDTKQEDTQTGPDNLPDVSDFLLDLLTNENSATSDETKISFIIDPGIHLGRITSFLISNTNHQVITCGMDDTIRVWDPENGREKKKFFMLEDQGTGGRVNCLAISSDDTLLAAGTTQSTTKATTNDDWNKPYIRVFDFQTGKILHTITGLKKGITSLFFTQDGNYLIASSEDNAINIWDTTRKFKTEQTVYLKEGNLTALYVISKDDDNIIVAAGSNRLLKTYSLEKNKKLCEFNTGETVTCLAVHPDYIAAGSNNKIMFLDHNLNVIKTIHREYDPGIFSFSPDNKYLLSASPPGDQFVLFDCESEFKEHFIGIDHTHTLLLAGFLDNQQLVLLDREQSTLSVMELFSGKISRRITANDFRLSEGIITEDGIIIKDARQTGHTIHLDDFSLESLKTEPAVNRLSVTSGKYTISVKTPGIGNSSPVVYTISDGITILLIISESVTAGGRGLESSAGERFYPPATGIFGFLKDDFVLVEQTGGKINVYDMGAKKITTLTGPSGRLRDLTFNKEFIAALDENNLISLWRIKDIQSKEKNTPQHLSLYVHQDNKWVLFCRDGYYADYNNGAEMLLVHTIDTYKSSSVYHSIPAFSNVYHREDYLKLLASGLSYKEAEAGISKQHPLQEVNRFFPGERFYLAGLGNTWMPMDSLKEATPAITTAYIYTIIHENLVFLTKIIVQGRLNFDISSQ